MIRFVRSPDFALGATAALIVAVSGLVGQFAARGMSLQQWFYGLTAIAGAITLAVIVRCWPKPVRAQVRVRSDDQDRA